MINPIFKGTVEKSNLIFDSLDKWKSYLLTLSGEVEIIARKPKTQRSINQNKYYWSVIVKILSNELGYFPDEIHEILKVKFLIREADIRSKIMKYSKSTTSLSTIEFEEYLTQIRTWASIELGMYLPLPNEAEY